MSACRVIVDEVCWPTATAKHQTTDQLTTGHINLGVAFTLDVNGTLDESPSLYRFRVRCPELDNRWLIKWNGISFDCIRWKAFGAILPVL